MPFHIVWHTRPVIMVSHATDPLMNEDFDDLQAYSMAMLQDAYDENPQRLVRHVYDVSQLDYHPPLYLMLGKALPVLRFKNRGDLYVATRVAKHRSLLQLTAHVMNFGLRFYDSYTDALRAAEADVAREGLHASATRCNRAPTHEPREQRFVKGDNRCLSIFSGTLVRRLWFPVRWTPLPTQTSTIFSGVR